MENNLGSGGLQSVCKRAVHSTRVEIHVNIRKIDNRLKRKEFLAEREVMSNPRYGGTSEQIQNVPSEFPKNRSREFR